MTGRTHDTAALTALLIAVILFPPAQISTATALAAFLANQVGGIAPDIDQPTAPLWRNLPVAGLFGRTVSKLLGGHRFLTHSLVGLWLLGTVSHWLLNILAPSLGSININLVWQAFMIGAFSHLVMDTITKEGVPWLLPVPVKFGIPPLRSLRLTTGGWIENLVIFPGLLTVNVALCSQYYPQVSSFLQTHVRP